MRGTRFVQATTQDTVGIIPAHAGNTQVLHTVGAHLGDHPRACGEHRGVTTHTLRRLGSSPRMRGTRGRTSFPPRFQGIIPAHAGNTGNVGGSRRRAGDHPRACGEHQVFSLIVTGWLGSSPRMRGTRKQSLLIRHFIGIIPAHAGNTSLMSCTAVLPRDHPRACGEHNQATAETVNRWGSSPRMRGTLNHVPPHKAITEDHPRACGEHHMATHDCNATRGSSPRMRGTPYARHPRSGRTGIIPAHAGNTQAEVKRLRKLGDHPRACGEHEVLTFIATMISGSSPRMRGTRDMSKQGKGSRGIIPAHAGNTGETQEW